MFEQLEVAPPDAILGLTEAYRKDPNPNKINLGVGVYQDAQGRTPVLNCVQEAERRLLEAAAGKSYLAIEGLAAYGRQVRRLLFDADSDLSDSGRAVTLQTPGGTAAVRLAADFLARLRPAVRVWHSRPTWANHPGILAAANCQVDSYPYLDSSSTGLAFDQMCDALRKMPEGDAVLLHACCHNPTGVDPDLEQWREIARLVRQRKLLPLIDFAYQGFGEGLDEDAAGVRVFCEDGGEALVCSSFSKNFGLYGERVGALTIVAGSSDAAAAALSHAKLAVRTNYSNPPQHGAEIVAEVLGDPQLRAQWMQELAAMRDRILAMREQFVATMRQKAPQHDFSFIARQRGMFSFSGLTPLQVDELKSKHSIYVVSSGGRINVAGMTADNMDRLCTAIAEVL